MKNDLRVPVFVLALAAFPASAQQARAYPAARHGGGYMHNYYLPPAPSSTPWAPSWSPDGKRVAFSMAGSLWTIDPATGVADEMAAGAKYYGASEWSPDGKWLVVTADDSSRSVGLEVLEVATGATRPLTTDAGVTTDPRFSPDGRWLAYVAARPNGYFNVFIRRFENGALVGDEVAVTRDHSFGRERLYFGEWDMHLQPAWFPDGKELLLVSNRDVPLGSGNVLRVPARANGIDAAKTVLSEQSLYRVQPDVSADGRFFVYSSTRGAADQWNNLWLQPTGGGEPYKLTFFQHDAFHPRLSRDGRRLVYVSNEGGLPQLVIRETWGGKEKKLPVVERRYKRPMGRLVVKTLDDEKSIATAARIFLTASDGKAYAPPDAYARVSGAGDRVFHSAGEAALELPAGKVVLDATKGLERVPAHAEVVVGAGKTTTVTLALKRLTDMTARCWHSGSTHVHMNYAGNLRNTLENLMFMGDAEDLDVINEQVANKDNRVLDHQYFVPGGGPHPLSTKERMLMVGEEYRPPFYGHVFMMGLRDHLLSPFVNGYEGTAIEGLFPSNTDMLRLAKEQGATTGYVHAFAGETDPLEGNLGGAKGFMVDAALGTVDALEWSSSGRAGFVPWYAALNNGLRIAAVGGEDSISNLHAWKLVGSQRTYVFSCDRGLEAPSWFENLRKGHAFVTSGPIVQLTVNGKKPGEDVRLPPGGRNVNVEAVVQSIVPLDKVWLVGRGETLREVPLDPDRKSGYLKTEIPIDKSGWILLRAEGKPEERFPLDTGFAQAFTNPVWISVGGQPVRDKSAAEYGMKWIDKLRTLAEAHPGWRSQQEKDDVFAQFAEARKVYERFAAEAAK